MYPYFRRDVLAGNIVKAIYYGVDAAPVPLPAIGGKQDPMIFKAGCLNDLPNLNMAIIDPY
jgi:hypothetical protein